MLYNAQQYYKKLFSKKNTDKQKRKTLLKIVTLKFCTSDKTALSEKITIEELNEAVKSSSKGKSPGTDGLGIELYKKCLFLLEGLLDMWEYSLRVGELSSSARLSLLKMLYKKDDPELISNYRPLTLGNTDYKIIAKVLALRLRKIIHKIISSNQTGFIPKRDIRNNVLETHYIL